MSENNTKDSPDFASISEFWADPLDGKKIEASLSEYAELANRPEEFYINKDIIEFKNDYQNFLEEKKRHVAKYTLPFTQTLPKFLGKPINFEFRAGELTVFAGENGSGKSMLLGQIGLHLVSRGATLYIASLEMSPLRTLDRMMTQTFCSESKRVINADDMNLFFERFKKHITIADLTSKITPDQLLRLLEAAVNYGGADVLIVDSLLMCVQDDMNKNETDYLMERLVEFAKINKVHVIVVAHCRKNNETTNYSVFNAASKDAIKGSSNITNVAFNVFVLAYDKSKTQKLAEGKQVDDSKPDFVLNLCKQRNGPFEGYISLWRDSASLNFCVSNDRIPNRTWLETVESTQEETEIEPYF